MAGEAQARGTPELAREQRFATTVQAAVRPNPALEICDMLAFDDGPIGETACRPCELHLTWYPLEGHFDMVIVGGGR